MSAAAFRQRLREDLKTAMRARNEGEVRLLRALGAAIDNAEAVPLGDEELRRFTEGEMARRELSDADIAARFEQRDLRGRILAQPRGQHAPRAACPHDDEIGFRRHARWAVTR